MHSTAKARSLFFLPALFHFRSKMSNSSTRSKMSGFARTPPKSAVRHFCRIGDGMHFQTKMSKSERF